MLTQKEIKQIEQFANELKKWADNLSYKRPSHTKVTLTPNSRWRYKKEILLLCEKTKVGAKVERDFDELDKLHQEYENWRAKTITEDNEEEFRLLIDSLKGTLYDLADTLQQIAQIYREELSSETPTETKQDIPSKRCGIKARLDKLVEKAWQIFTKSFWEAVFDRIFGPQ